MQWYCSALRQDLLTVGAESMVHGISLHSFFQVRVSLQSPQNKKFHFKSSTAQSPAEATLGHTGKQLPHRHSADVTWHTWAACLIRPWVPTARPPGRTRAKGREAWEKQHMKTTWVMEQVDQGGRAGCGGPGVEALEHAGVVTTYRPFLNTPPAECWSFRLRAMRSVKTSIGTWEQACDSPLTPSGAGFFKRQLWTFWMYGTCLHGPIVRAQLQTLLLGQGVLRV